MIRLLLIFALAIPAYGQMLQSIVNNKTAAAAGTFTLVQFKYNDSLGGGTGGSSCDNATTGVCNVTVSALGSGHLVACVGFFAHSVAVTVSCTATSNTFTHCAGAHGCAFGNSTAGFLDAAYVLSSTSGATNVACTSSLSSLAYLGCGVYEYSYSGSSISFDTSNGAIDTACTTCAAQALTLTGTTDVIIQTGIPANSLTAISGAYTNPAQFYSGAGNAGRINTTDGTAPNWTQNVSGQVTVMAIAFKGN